MASKKLFDIQESEEELQKLIKSQKDFQLEKRIKCLLLLKEGRFKKRTELADYLCIGYSTLKRWLHIYREEGLESYLHIGTGYGRESIVSKELHDALAEKVNSSEDYFYSYVHAQRWVEENFNQKISYHTLREYLIRHFGTKLKSPRKSHYKKDDQAVNAFKKTTKSDQFI